MTTDVRLLHAVRRLWPTSATDQVAGTHALSLIPDPPGPHVVARVLEDIHWCARQPSATAHIATEVAMPAERQVRRCAARILHTATTDPEQP